MTCEHPHPFELPCPWPECPAGTPQQAVALLRGSEGVVRGKSHVSLSIEADDGVELYRRRRTADGWEWVTQGS
jgi:hypothetical protein